jgi:iron complex outermembrane receptor protein
VNHRFISAVLLLVALPAQAQEEDLEVEMFFASEETVTSAARHEQDIGMSPSAITVLTREDIEASGATNVVDLLRLVPGLDVVTTSPAYPTISGRLNWTNEGIHFLVLVDGREANLEPAGFVLWEIQPFSLQDVERIEVIRGPGSSLYGANALAGVVSITTRAMPEKTAAWTGLSLGEVGQLTALARASTRLGDWGFSLNGGVETLGTFTDPRHEGKQIWKLRSVVEYRLSDKRRLLLDGGMAGGSGSVAAALSEMNADMYSGNLRLLYESEDLRGQLYWTRGLITADLTADLEFGGIRLARLVDPVVYGDVVDAEVQWTLPTLWKPLLLITGASGRVSWISSDELLDGDTYSDITSPRYHQPGVDHREARAGAFLHGELTPAEWMTCTFGLRVDYNTETDEFFSPRLAAVFRPLAGQFLRVGAARSFRKPAFFDSGMYMMAEFPEDSPITGAGREQFQEFMTRVLGNPDLENEELISFELGYLGRFADGKLNISLDLYYNIYRNEFSLYTNVVPDETGLPDLDNSSIMNENNATDLIVIGSELSLRYSPNQWISLLASWSWREVTERSSDESPKHLITVGGRFRTDWGLIGSLYAFSRSEFWDRWISNPAGMLEPFVVEHMKNVILIMGKVGWQWRPTEAIGMEAGLKLFLPISPFEEPYFRYREKGGGVTRDGLTFGGDLLRRMVTAYLEGSF